jgi:hypothetical protein
VKRIGIALASGLVVGAAATFVGGAYLDVGRAIGTGGAVLGVASGLVAAVLTVAPDRVTRWTTAIAAALQIGLIVLWLVSLVGTARRSVGWEVHRPGWLVIGLLVTIACLVAGVFLVRSAWRRPSRSRLAAPGSILVFVVAALGLLVAGRSLAFYPGPAIIDMDALHPADHERVSETMVSLPSPGP